MYKNREMSIALLLSAALLAPRELVASDGTPKPDPKAEYVRKLIPTSISGAYTHGELVVMRLHDRNAYIVKPKGKVDPQKRWVWIFPFWLGVNDGHGRLHHEFYVEKYLAAGFSVGGIDVGTSCGSPAAAGLCHEFYEKLTAEHGLCAGCGWKCRATAD